MDFAVPTCVVLNVNMYVDDSDNVSIEETTELDIINSVDDSEEDECML